MRVWDLASDVLSLGVASPDIGLVTPYFSLSVCVSYAVVHPAWSVELQTQPEPWDRGVWAHCSSICFENLPPYMPVTSHSL